MRRARAKRPRPAPPPSRRFLQAQLVVIAAFLILAGRLYQLQVLAGDYYLRKSADNFVKELELPATRGHILDRRGRLLVDNRSAYNVYVTPRFFTSDGFARLRRFLELSDAQAAALEGKVAQKRGLDRFREFLAFEDITRDQLAVLESEKNDLPGVAVQAVAHRSYPHGALAAHALGYMNQIAAEELADRRLRTPALNYHAGDYVGRSGLERQWEGELRGKDGVERVIVDAKGQRKEGSDLDSLLEGPQRTEPMPGHDLVTTIDLDLQRSVERALAKHLSGAAVVVEVTTGRILAIASWPEPDPNLLTGRLSRTQADELNHDPLRRLLDKTVREHYFPGSTFKVVPTIAALEGHLVDPEEQITCHGGLRFGRRVFHCDKDHLKVDLHFALAESCNVYYFQLGQTVGLDRMAEVAEALGFGAPTGIGINGEVAGVVPSSEYYKKNERFEKGFVLNTAIGQGSTKVTVLQEALAYAAIANGGALYYPQLVERVQTAGGETVERFPPRLRRRLPFSAATLATVRAALYDAVNHPKGTSYEARRPGLEVAGKTGTAQVGKNHRGEGQEGDASNSHAWFASFAPYEKPEIAVVVLIEHGGFGAKAATPTAMAIYADYFQRQGGAAAQADEPAAGEPARQARRGP